MNLFKTQCRLLLRGLFLLEIDGLLCYSTCSLNPIENEAVVTTALELLNEYIEIIDFKDLIKDFKMKDGINNCIILIFLLFKILTKF